MQIENSSIERNVGIQDFVNKVSLIAWNAQKYLTLIVSSVVSE